jgi:integrase
MAVVAGIRLPRGIRARGDSFLVSVGAGPTRQTATCHSLEEALAKQRELKAGEPSAPAAEVWTLQRALDTTVRVAWADTRGEHTAQVNAQSALDHFGPETTLDRITTDALDEYVQALKDEGLANGTINRKLAALSKVLTVAVDRRGLAFKPKLPRLREGVGRIRYLTADEERVLLGLLGQWSMPDHVDAITVLVDTGLRVGELFRLTARDVDQRQRLLHVWENKADHPRSVPLTKRAYEVIKRRMHGAAYGGPDLFPYNHDWLRRPWDRAKVTMGLGDDKQFVPHTLRHTCASRLVQRSVPLKVVQEWMGHKTIQVTMRYAHLAPANLLAAVQALEGDDDR